METFFQLIILGFIVTIGLRIIFILTVQKGNLLLLIMDLINNQLFVALIVILCVCVAASRLGVEIYKSNLLR